MSRFISKFGGAGKKTTQTTTSSHRRTAEESEHADSVVGGPAVNDFVMPEPLCKPRSTPVAVPSFPGTIRFAAAQIVGRNHPMEDIVVCREIKLPDGNVIHMLAVFDGHGNDKCATFCSRRLYKILNEMAPVFAATELSKWDELLRQVVLTVGDQWLADAETYAASGSCVVVALIYGLDIFCANLGDCRMIVSHPVEGVKQISKDHRASDPVESQRISRAGGYVENGRVNKILSPSRAFGDGDLRMAGSGNNVSDGMDTVIHDPHVVHLRMRAPESGTMFAVLASDGVFDEMSNEQVHHVVHNVFRKRHGGSVEDAARQVATFAAATNDDDVSCIVVEWKMSGKL